jgi:2-hydroxy-3-keto-5-methylthiopentenyl-1-phosphate phosphatase
VAELLIAVDFDGTITMHDTLHVIVDAHGRPGVWDELEPALRAGEITVEQAMEQQFATVTAPHDEVIDLVLAHAGTRDGFPELVRWAEDTENRLVVMSAGFRCVIDEVLDGLGVGHLEVVANDAVFTHDGCTLVWSEDRGDTCQLCGRKCKRHAINERFNGERLVYVGDGISDRCASLLADVVFARAGLAEWLDEQGVGYIPYGDFHDVLRWLKNDPDVAEAA